MFYRRFFTITLLAVAMLFLSAVQAEEPAELTTRIFYLQDMNSREAVTLLRQEVQIRRVAHFDGKGLIVVADDPARVDRSEALLRERDALVRVVEPYEPVDPNRAPEDLIAERDFIINESDFKMASILPRVLYGAQEITEDADANRLTMRDPERVLDAVEALFRELNLLAEGS